MAMIEEVPNTDLETLAPFDAVIDVRSPAEFAEDHIPGAINLPVLSNEERAEVGTIYVQESRFKARRMGAAYVARNVARHLETALADKPATYRPLLYCWRGGMRSYAMATILTQVGWRTGVLKGGYKTWRRSVVTALRQSDDELNIILLDGQTGTAKSEILQQLAKLGAQTIDLEALAGHRGSVFGGYAAHPQPSQKKFESYLWDQLRRLDAKQPTLVEAESCRIGQCEIPPLVWRSMLAAPHMVVTADVEARANYLVHAYDDIVRDRRSVLGAIDRLAPFHNKKLIEEWREMAANDRFQRLAASLMQEHYDPLYDKARKRRNAAALTEIRLERLDEGAIDTAAGNILALLNH